MPLIIRVMTQKLREIIKHKKERNSLNTKQTVKDSSSWANKESGPSIGMVLNGNIILSLVFYHQKVCEWRACGNGIMGNVAVSKWGWSLHISRGRPARMHNIDRRLKMMRVASDLALFPAPLVWNLGWVQYSLPRKKQPSQGNVQTDFLPPPHQPPASTTGVVETKTVL